MTRKLREALESDVRRAIWVPGGYWEPFALRLTPVHRAVTDQIHTETRYVWIDEIP